MKIVLIGFMGTGKTQVGKALARHLSWKFLDTDSIIEKKEGRRISTIFKEEGEAYFRDIESRVIRDVSRLKNVVISAGGGAVLRRENIERLKKRGIILCLYAKPMTILRRLKGDRSRPLLKGKNKLNNVRRILRFRMPYYRAAAGYFIHTDGLTIRQITGKVLEAIHIP